jgi:hypothetical protein
MAMSYKARRRWALVILLIGMPIYIAVALVILIRLSLWQFPVVVEFGVFVVVGVAWVFPLKPVFKGVGQADPDAKD